MVKGDTFLQDNKFDGKVSFKQSSTLDASGRLRVSQLSTIGEYKVLNSNFDTRLLEQTGTATFTNNVNRVNIAVASGQYGIITSKQYHPYLNGKSQLIEMTTANFGGALNVEKSIGYISSDATSTYNTGLDGFRLHKSTANVYSFQVWRNGTKIIEVLQSDWYDRLDGSGESGMTINWNNFNVFAFDFLYLGGTALGLYVMHNGEFRLVNKYYYANTDTQPFILSPNKPIRYEIRSTTGTGNLDFICALVGTEAPNYDSIGQSVSVKGATAGVSSLVAGTTYAICGVRKATNFRDIFASVTSFEGIISTNDFIDWQLILNPTVAGTFTYSALSGSPLETAVGAVTNTVTGGTIICNTYSSLNMNNAKSLENILSRLNSTINNTMDSIVLCATPSLGSTNVKVTGSMQVRWVNQ